MRPRQPGTTVESERDEEDDGLVNVMVGETTLDRRATMSVGGQREGGRLPYFIASADRPSGCPPLRTSRPTSS